MNPLLSISLSLMVFLVPMMLVPVFAQDFENGVVTTSSDTSVGPQTYSVDISVGSSVPGCEETNTCYSPADITINAGDTIQWVNVDAAAHTVTGGSPSNGVSGEFDSSLIMAGGTFSVTFDETGEHPYFCMVHPWKTGLVTVGGSSDTSVNSEPLSVSAEIGENEIGYNPIITTLENVSGTSVLFQVQSFDGTTVFEDDWAVDETHSGILYWNHINYHPTGIYTISVTDDVVTASTTVNWVNPEPEPSITVWTNNDSYTSGDILDIEGTVRELYSGTPVSVIIKAPNGNLVSIQQVVVQPNKTFYAEFDTATSSSLMKVDGVYMITAQYGTPNRSAETSFTFEQEIPPFGDGTTVGGSSDTSVNTEPTFVYLETDEYVYNQYDEIEIEGQISNPTSDTRVNFQLIRGGGIIELGYTTLYGGGYFEKEGIQVDPAWGSGEITLRATYGGIMTEYDFELDINIPQPTPERTTTVQTNKDIYDTDDVIVISGIVDPVYAGGVGTISIQEDRYTFGTAKFTPAEDGTFSYSIARFAPSWNSDGIYTVTARYNDVTAETNIEFEQTDDKPSLAVALVQRPGYSDDVNISVQVLGTPLTVYDLHKFVEYPDQSRNIDWHESITTDINGFFTNWSAHTDYGSGERFTVTLSDGSRSVTDTWFADDPIGTMPDSDSEYYGPVPPESNDSTYSIVTPSDLPLLTLSQQWESYGTNLLGELNGYNLPPRGTAIINVEFPDDRTPMQFDVPITQGGTLNMPWMFSIYNPQGEYRVILDTLNYVFECAVVYDGQSLQTDTCEISKVKENGDLEDSITTPVLESEDSESNYSHGSGGGSSGSSDGGSSGGTSGSAFDQAEKNRLMGIISNQLEVIQELLEFVRDN